MSFLSRLGLQSVSATESNHGQLENFTDVVPAGTLREASGMGTPMPVSDDQAEPQEANTNPPEEESEEERPDPIETEGAILQSDMILVLPDFEIHFLNKSKFKNTVSIFSTAGASQNALIAEFTCDFFVGFNSTENRKTVDNMHILSPGTHLFAEDLENHYYCEYEKI